MALERQSIEKKDFPIGRRGYDPDAVDAHLTALANEVDELKRSSRRRSETLASSASEQVRAIVEAAESSAAEIQREAEDEAREIKAEAASEAQSTREQAGAQAREYVSKVSESTSVMLQRLDAMDSELGALIESLRTGSNRLGADLQLLEGNLSEVHEAVAPRPRFEPEPESAPAPPAAVAPPPPPQARPAAPPAAAPPPPAETYDDMYDEQYEEDVDGAAAGEEADDAEGARLIALNMALNGSSREETERYLAENFQLADRAGLLDEVYASVEG
ncbi:MAG TPA: DivIVA domain-containing protein [Solirubrobacteraceae bacterium]|nr:DivIVA domain-containing protein [Solirubrobacteraceae bacterium]